MSKNWTQHDVRKHMHVYDRANNDLGQVAEVYEDSFVIHKGLLFHKDRYIPYNAIATLENDRLQLNMSRDEVQQFEWEIRPDYEDHPGDPLQLMYDRGHGVSDPFDENNPDRT